MKKLTSLVFVALIVVLSSGAAGAPGVDTHLVKKGDCCFSVIGKKYGVDWKEMAKLNNRKSPYSIFVGEKLKIPQLKRVAKSRVAGFSRWVFPGKNKYKGGCAIAKKPQSIRETLENQLGEKSQYKGKYGALIPIFERRVSKGDYTMKKIEIGEFFNSMDFTRDNKTVTVTNLIVAWNLEYVKNKNISWDAERYIEEFNGYRVMFTIPYACCNPSITITSLPPQPIPQAPRPPEKGRIVVKKEAIDFKNNPITPVPQFTFALDVGVAESRNDSAGETIFEVDAGFHVVEELEVEGWKQLSTTPPNGRVQVKPGQTVTVLFKNRQVLPPQEVPVPPVTPTPPTEEPPQELVPPPIEPEPKSQVDRWELESEFNGVLGQWKRTRGRLGDLGLRGNFYSADETVWYHQCEKCPWRWGIGFIAGYDDWKADFGRGRGYRVGPHVGGKLFETTGENSYRLGEFKIRPFTFEVQKFRAKFSKDKSVQRSIVPELRLGYEVGEIRNYRSFKPERFGIFFNLRVPIHRDKNSNFITREDGLSTVMGGIWGQWKLVNSPNLALRVTAAPFYQQWDKQTGIFTGATLRYEGPIDLMVGPFVNFFPFRPGSGQLIGWAGQIELRNAVQFTYRKYRERQLTQVDAPPAESIKAFEDDALGDPDEEKEISESSEKVRKEIRTLERDVEQKVEHLVLVRSSWPEDSTNSKAQIAASETDENPEIANQDFHPDLD